MSTFANSSLRSPPREVYPSREDVIFSTGGTLIFGESEERSQLPAQWVQHFRDGQAYQISELESFGQITIDRIPGVEFSLRENLSLRSWISSLDNRPIYLDITGLSHHVWMPLLRIILENNKEVHCIYTEPGRYTPSTNPRPGEFYQLSEKVRGLRPIPTFARIPSRSQSSGLLVALLGFEGVRFKYLVENVQPDEHDIFPIVGVPGFEIDYPFHTFEGNADILKSTRSWQRLDYVDASCPFSLFRQLEVIRKDWPTRFIQLAVIGTKPHALGAMLYALRDNSVEILHDHPIKKAGRTQGSGRCHLYRVSTFWSQGY